jgi:hypothetical protein
MRDSIVDHSVKLGSQYSDQPAILAGGVAEPVSGPCLALRIESFGQVATSERNVESLFIEEIHLLQ